MSKVVEIQAAAKGELDDLFIEYYLNHSEKHGVVAEAYDYAKKMLGQTYNEEYAKQYGRSIFNRLRDKISESLDQKEVEDACLGRNILRKLASDDTVPASTRVAAAKELTRKRIDRPSISKQKNLGELDKEIEAINERLKGIEDG